MARGAKRAAAGAEPVEGPWELPPAWRWERLGAVLPLAYGKALPARARSGGGKVPVYGSSGPVGFHDEALTEGPTVLVGRKGSAGAVHFSKVPCWPIDTAYYVKAREGIELKYAYYLLKHLRLDSLDQSTAIPSLGRDNYSDVTAPFPPYEMQLRIVARIEELFAEIDEGERVLGEAADAARTYRMALERALLTGSLAEDGQARCPSTVEDLLAGVAGVANHVRRRTTTWPLPSDLPALPHGWRWVRLADLICEGPANGYSPKASHGATGTRSLKLTATSGGRMRLDPDCIKVLNETIEDGSSLFLREGDVLFQRGNTPELVGIAAMFEGPPDAYVYPDLMIRVRTPTMLLSRWIWRWANSPSGRAYMMDKAQGAAGSMPKISGETVRKLPVPIGPSQHMTRALEMLEAAQAADVAPALEAAASTAQSLRQSILAAAFRGDLVA